MQPKIYLQEAFKLEGKDKEAIRLGRQNVAQFTRVLGPSNKLAVAALHELAVEEGLAGDYQSAIDDNLSIVERKASDPAAKFDVENILITASGFACISGQYAKGIDLAKRALKESSTPPNIQPAYINEAKFQQVDCLLLQQENSNAVRQVGSLKEADNLLKTVDIKPVVSTFGLRDFEGMLDLAKGRLALLEGQNDQAKQFAVKANPFLIAPGADPESRKQLERLEAAIARVHADGS